MILEEYTAASIAIHIRELSQHIADETRGEIELTSLIITKLTDSVGLMAIVSTSKEKAMRAITKAYTVIEEQS